MHPSVLRRWPQALCSRRRRRGSPLGACGAAASCARSLRTAPRPAWPPGRSHFTAVPRPRPCFAGAALSTLIPSHRSDPHGPASGAAAYALKSAPRAAQISSTGGGDALRRTRSRLAARAGARAGGTGLFRLPDARWPRRSFAPRAPRRRRSRPTGAARPAKGRGARRRAPGGGRARPAGPGRRGRGRCSGHCARARRRAARDFCADAALARSLGWPTPLPLLASELFAPPRRGRGPAAAPGRGRLEKLAALAYARAALAALDLAHDLSRRAARLADAAPKLRAKGKTGAIEALLADDAVSAAAPIANLSDRARRRLFERLVRLSAARELTGRPTFRLYGL